MSAARALATLLLAALSFAAHAAPPAPSVQPGKVLYQRWCVSCHGAGPGHPGTLALETIYEGKLPAVLEQGTSLDGTAIAYFVRHGRSTMPTFRKTEISDAELTSIVQYLAPPKPGTGDKHD